MKKLIYLFSIVFAVMMFSVTNVSAQGHSGQDDQGQNDQGNNGQDQDNHGHNGHGNNGNDDGQTSTALPINTGVEFLMIAGLVIGIVSVNAYKSAKKSAIQE